VVTDFEWDVGKAFENEAKHGVSFSEATETFLDPYGFAYYEKTKPKKS
jgi:uncharacterized DUF497 family protein